MQIEITGEAEMLVKAAIASGMYGSAEEFVAKMAADWDRTRSNGRTLPTMPLRVDVEALIAAQGIRVCDDPASLPTDLWPKDESTDDFLAFLRESRRDHADPLDRS